MEVFTHFDNRLKVELDTNWDSIRPQPYGDATSFGYRFSHSILPSDGAFAPKITVSPGEFEPDHPEYVCIVQFKAKDIPMKTLAFWVIFPRGPAFLEPHILSPTRYGTNGYRLVIPFDFKTSPGTTNSFFIH